MNWKSRLEKWNGNSGGAPHHFLKKTLLKSEKNGLPKSGLVKPGKWRRGIVLASLNWRVNPKKRRPKMPKTLGSFHPPTKLGTVETGICWTSGEAESAQYGDGTVA